MPFITALGDSDHVLATERSGQKTGSLRVCGSRGLETDRQENDFTVRIRASDLHRVGGRVGDANIRALGLGGNTADSLLYRRSSPLAAFCIGLDITHLEDRVSLLRDAPSTSSDPKRPS